jgi:hypothetical protein
MKPLLTKHPLAGCIYHTGRSFLTGDRQMNKRTPIALVAALLLSGITAAAAAGMTQASPSDSLSLSSTQQKTA